MSHSQSAKKIIYIIQSCLVRDIHCNRARNGVFTIKKTMGVARHSCDPH
jgi:hypothetical protein